MKTRFKFFYISLYMSVLLILLLGTFGYFEGLHAESKVIETFEAGPIKTPKKEVYRVKTHFEWTMQNPCPCNGEEAPCIKTFLNKDLPSEEPPEIQSYEHLNQSSDKYQGGEYVPTIIRETSVRLIVVPFCGQAKDDEKS